LLSPISYKRCYAEFTTGKFHIRIDAARRTRIYLRQRCFDASKPRVAAATGAQCPEMGRKTIVKPRLAAAANTPNSANTIAEKAIRFQHPDYNPDRAQKLISSSMSRHLSTRNISSKYMHAFLSNLANRQTDRQTNERGQKHNIPAPLAEVNNSVIQT